MNTGLTARMRFKEAGLIFDKDPRQVHAAGAAKRGCQRAFTVGELPELVVYVETTQSAGSAFGVRCPLPEHRLAPTHACACPLVLAAASTAMLLTGVCSK